MEIYMVCGFRLLQSKHLTSQHYVQRQTCCRHRRKHWIDSNFEVGFQSIYFYIEYVDFKSLSSIHCVNTSGLKVWNSTLKREFQSNVFDDVRNKLVSAHCPVTSNVLTVTDENHKRCVFPILPVNVPWS